MAGHQACYGKGGERKFDDKCFRLVEPVFRAELKMEIVDKPATSPPPAAFPSATAPDTGFTSR